MNHYGVTVDKDTPITGVFNANEVDWLWDDMDINWIDMFYADHVAECENDDHDECFGEESGNLWIYGYVDKDGIWQEDKECPYSAIYNRETGYVQVTRSKYGIKCKLCSPCYPGQGDVNSEGEFTAYSFPPDMFNEENEFVSRIFEIGKE